MASKEDQVRDLVKEIHRIDYAKGQDEIVKLDAYYKQKYANWAEYAL